jgi:uncharacterized protein YaaQ
VNSQLLMLAIIQAEDAEVAVDALTRAGLPATCISSTGGFLHKGNVTLLLALERDEAPQAVKLLAANCRERTVLVNTAIQTADVHAGYIMPLEVTVGGATIFGLPTESVVYLGAQEKAGVAETVEGSKDDMKLIIAIVSEEYSGEILDSLIAAQYPATLISTTGGFLRKGNATLLVGVEADNVEGVLACIEGTCAAKDLEKPATAQATIFVLDVEQYRQV